jgi:phosphoenolpyruvate carboxylase
MLERPPSPCSPLFPQHIASRYADLVDSAAVRDAVFPRIVAEHSRTIASVIAIKRLPSLLADEPLLEASVAARRPFMDPLNFLQVELLQAYRSGQTDERTRRAVHLTINGLAHGLRNSG